MMYVATMLPWQARWVGALPLGALCAHSQGFRLSEASSAVMTTGKESFPKKALGFVLVCECVCVCARACDVLALPRNVAVMHRGGMGAARARTRAPNPEETVTRKTWDGLSYLQRPVTVTGRASSTSYQRTFA